MKSLYLILFLALGTLPACSHFTANGRRQLAYARQVKKIRVNRERRMAELHKKAPKMPPKEMMVPSEPRETIQRSEGPQSVTSSPDNQ
jgi:hypothetical protein